MRLLFFIPIWKRPEITKVCFEGVKRLQKHYNIQAFCIISEEWPKSLCKEYGFDYYYTENYPLGVKMNQGFKQAMKKDFDYLVQINSDSLLHEGYMELSKGYTEEGIDFFGLRDIYFYHPQTNRAKYFCYDEYSVLGCGKFLKKSMLEKLNMMGVEPWRNDTNEGMDNHMSFTLAKHWITPEVIYQKDQILAIDIKSDVNIWAFDHDQFKEAPGVNGDLITQRFKELKCLEPVNLIGV